MLGIKISNDNERKLIRLYDNYCNSLACDPDKFNNVKYFKDFKGGNPILAIQLILSLLEEHPELIEIESPEFTRIEKNTTNEEPGNTDSSSI